MVRIVWYLFFEKYLLMKEFFERLDSISLKITDSLSFVWTFKNIMIIYKYSRQWPKMVSWTFKQNHLYSLSTRQKYDRDFDVWKCYNLLCKIEYDDIFSTSK